MGAAARIGGLALATSAWWLVMQLIQSGKGADLLAYSESLEDVSLTATSVEAWRSLGYWLMYVRDAYAPTTTAGADYMTDLVPVVCGFLLVVAGLLGLALVQFRARRFAVAMTFTGLVLAVGVHPFDDPSPVARLFRGDGQEGLSLALRSSTRALPLLVIGLSLGAAALVDTIGRVVVWRRVLLAAVVAAIALGNLPVLTSRGLVDPALERDEQPPAAWTAAAEHLDGLAPGYRVLQLPGAEFGAFTWGYTVDPPLPGLTDRPFASRDLLPLGSPAAMDLLFALDDRFQTGAVELDAVAPIARLFGADTVWLPGDAAFDRFRTPRPELTSELFAAGSDGLGAPQAYGEPAVNAPRVPMVDEQSLSEPAVGRPVAPVELVPVVDAVPVVRASDAVVLLAGSGDGIVDAAAAGLLAGDEAVRYSASMSTDELIGAAATADLIVVTDTNRRRAHHWRGSQDVTGYTEPASGDQTVWDDSGDARLDVFPGAATAAFTVSAQPGPVSVRASSYGERFAYLPEARPGMAIDGDPNTAWTVLDPTGQYLELTTDGPVDHVTLLQPAGLADVRHLETVTVSVDGGAPQSVTLDERSLIAGQRVPLPATARPGDDPHLARAHRRVCCPSWPRPSRPDAGRPRRSRRRPRRQPRADRRAQRSHRRDARGRGRASGDVRADPRAGAGDEPLACRPGVAHRPPTRRPLRRAGRGAGDGAARPACVRRSARRAARHRRADGIDPPHRGSVSGRLGRCRRRHRDGVDHAVRPGGRRHTRRRAGRPSGAADAAAADRQLLAGDLGAPDPGGARRGRPRAPRRTATACRSSPCRTGSRRARWRSRSPPSPSGRPATAASATRW